MPKVQPVQIDRLHPPTLSEEEKRRLAVALARESDAHGVDPNIGASPERVARLEQYAASVFFEAAILREVMRTGVGVRVNREGRVQFTERVARAALESVTAVGVSASAHGG